MYELFIGSHERVIGRNAFHKSRNRFIPCKVTGYSFKTHKYTLLTSDGKIVKTSKVYLETTPYDHLI